MSNTISETTLKKLNLFSRSPFYPTYSIYRQLFFQFFKFRFTKLFSKPNCHQSVFPKPFSILRRRRKSEIVESMRRTVWKMGEDMRRIGKVVCTLTLLPSYPLTLLPSYPLTLLPLVCSPVPSISYRSFSYQRSLSMCFRSWRKWKTGLAGWATYARELRSKLFWANMESTMKSTKA